MNDYNSKIQDIPTISIPKDKQDKLSDPVERLKLEIPSILDEFESISKPKNTVDAFEFTTSVEYLSINPTPFQRLVVKTLYNLWRVYPPDKEELKLIRILKNKWQIDIDFDRPDPVMFLVLALGRRSTKSTTMSILASYAVYQLVCLDHPQKYYGIRARQRIYITHIAASARQAEEVFTMTKDNIRHVPFFRRYIDFDKDTSSDLRLFTPYDLRENEAIRLRNKTLPKGYTKESLLPGSIQVKSITTSAASNRGDSTYMLLFSELAHFKRAKFIQGQTEEQIAAENPQSDYAIVKALVPSTKDYKQDAKVVFESSPAEKGGEFYKQYCIAAGSEQDDFDTVERAKYYQAIQLATWEARPGFTEQDFETEFANDPMGASMEYGAHFANPSGQFISEEVINAIPIPNKPFIRNNPSTYRFVVSVDPGGKAKAKVADTYAIAWGHSEFSPVVDELTGEETREWIYHVDGMHGFDAKNKATPGGRIEQIAVDPDDVLEFLIELIKDLGGRNFVREIVYDQWESMSAISALQKAGYTAFETTFIPEYKSKMYGNFLQQAQNRRVHMYGEDFDTGGWVHRWKLEMKYLQRSIRGKHTFYHHPTTGPVRNDDFADVVANLVYRLVLQTHPTRESAKKTAKQAKRPVEGPYKIKPVMAHRGGGDGGVVGTSRGVGGTHSVKHGGGGMVRTVPVTTRNRFGKSKGGVVKKYK